MNPIINWFCVKRSIWSSGSSGISGIEVARELAACVPLEPISSQCQVRDVWPKEPIWSSYDGLTNSIRSNCCELTRQFCQPATQTSSVIFHDWVGKCLVTSKNASYLVNVWQPQKMHLILENVWQPQKVHPILKMSGNLKKCIFIIYIFIIHIASYLEKVW